MGKYFSGIFAVLMLLWVMYFMSPASQIQRVKNFCSPMSYVAKIGGSVANIADSEAGTSIAEEGSGMLRGGCEERFGPPFLSVFGIYDKEKAAKEQKDLLLEVIKKERAKMQQNLLKINSPQAKAEFKPEELQLLERSIRHHLAQLDAKEKEINEGNVVPVDGVLEKDKL